MLGDHPGEGDLRLVRRERDRVGKVGAVFGHRRHRQNRSPLAIEPVEVRVAEGHRQLAGAVRAEVDEDDRIAAAAPS